MDRNATFTLDDWNRAVEEAVTDYGDVVKVWEIWNEPTDKNYTFFDNGPANYTKMLEVAYGIIKLAEPNSIVIGLGGLHMYSGGESWVKNGTDFARDVVLLGGMNYCDAVSLHAYPWGESNYTLVQEAFNNSIIAYRNIIDDKIFG